jgi:hypothetical protein
VAQASDRVPAARANQVGSSPSADPDAWLTAGKFGLILAALIFVAFPQVLLGIETFFIRDYGLFSYPNAVYQRESFWRGELPFWNPYTYCGVPFLAQWNTMPLYPLSLVYLLAPVSWSLSFFCLLHLEIAGLGMYFLAHRWANNRLAAAIAGLAFAFNGLALNLLIWPSHVATYSWMPWVLWAAERTWREGGRWVLWAALVGTMQILAGGPETIVFTWALVGALWGLECVSRRVPPNSVLRLALVVLLVGALAAPQLLPFIQLAHLSQRGLGEGTGMWSLPARGWANFLVPMAFGSVWKENLFFQHGQSWTSSYYLGIAIVLLALLAVWKVRSPRAWFLLAAAFVAFVLALGEQTALGSWLRSQVPALTLSRYPVTYVIVIAFVGPLLAAMSAAHWRKSVQEMSQSALRSIYYLAAALVVLIGFILMWAWNSPRPNDDVSEAIVSGLSRIGFLLATVAAFWLLAQNRGPRWQQVFSIALLLLLWLDVWTHEPSQNPTASPAIYATGFVRNQLALNPEPVLGKSRVMISPAAYAHFATAHIADVNTYLAARLACFCNVNLLDGTPAVNGFFSLSPLESNGLIGLFYAFPNLDLSRLQDFLAISYITAPSNALHWQARPSFLPLVTASQGPVFLDDTNAVHQMMRPDFDATKVVFLPVEAQGFVSVTRPTAARIISQRFERQRVELELEAPEPSLVVIAQSYYPCWRAYADDHPVPLLRANYAFQAVQVPAGTHRLRLVYEDRAFQFGALLCSLALVGCAAYGLKAWLSSRKGLVPAAGAPVN